MKMIRPFLLTAGSRGDIEPLLALSGALLTSQHVDQTTLCIPADMMHLAPSSSKRFEAVPLTFSLARAMDYVPAFRSDVEHGNTSNHRTDGSSIMGSYHRDLILPDTKRILSIAEASNCTIVVSTIFTFPIAQIVSEKLHIPLISLELQPNIPSRYYPNIFANSEEAAAAICALQQGDITSHKSEKNLESHYALLHELFAHSLEAMNKERSYVGLPPTTVEDIMNVSSNPNFHVFAAFHSQLMPRAPDFPPNVQIVGSLAAAYTPAEWNPEKTQQELAAFLRSGPPPAMVSYGSMESQGAAPALMKALLSGMIDAGVQRVVIVPGNARLGLHHLDEELDKSLHEWAKGRVFVTEGNVQYSWLLPQCEMIFCHCGAGTTSAALQAGIPILATPIFADQIFFAELVKRMKLGDRVGTVGLPSVTAASVMKGVISVRKENVVAAVRNFFVEQKRLDESVEKVGQLVEQISCGGQKRS